MKVYQKVLCFKMYFHFSLQDHWSNSIVYPLLYRRILSLLEDTKKICKKCTWILHFKLRFYYKNKIHRRTRRDLQMTPNTSSCLQEAVFQVLWSYRSPIEMETPKACQAIYSLASPLKFSVILKINLLCCNLAYYFLFYQAEAKEMDCSFPPWSNLLYYRVFVLSFLSD